MSCPMHADTKIQASRLPAPAHEGHSHSIASHNAHASHVSAAVPREAGSFKLAAQSTVHCLTGCAIGEFAGLAIGVTLGFSPWTTMALATFLAYVSGYTLGLVPLVRMGHTWLGAFKVIWLGETISIGVMELVMNFTDYHVGGVTANSIFEPVFWYGFALALPAGFVVALPVNYWLLKRNYKQHCH